MKNNNQLILGKTDTSEVIINTKTLQRHFACFGSSGSGKTVASKVLIEELARNGVPVIAFDPQGDIASIGLPGSKEDIEKQGTDTAILDAYNDNVEVVVWTPGSSKGIPLSINPLQFDDVEKLNAEDKIRFFSSTSKNISSLVGYDSNSDDGKSAEAILSVIFEYCHKEKVALNDFNDLVGVLKKIPESIQDVISSVGSSAFIKGLTKKLSLLTLGTRKLIFQTGVPASIDALLGLDGSTEKTRISVIYLNTLHSSEEKEFFIAGISQLLYRWMLKNPLKNSQTGIQCALFIDEIAPYIPPVKVPACKENLELLFRQGRKYGVSCLIATQSPGDIDYKAIGQFSTFILGTLNTKQDIEKVKKRLESVAPKEIDYITGKLPALKPGNFLAISPDEFSTVQQMKVRWLVTEHRVVSEKQIAEINSTAVSDYYDRVINERSEDKSNITDDADDKPNPEQISKTDKPKAVKGDTNDKDQIIIVKNMIMERFLAKEIRSHLKGGLFKSEKIASSQFIHLPLIQVAVTFFEKKGLFKKTITEIPENLYLDYNDHKMVHVKKDHFVFSSVIDRDPHKIDDLDNFCTLSRIDRDDVDFDFRSLGGRKINKDKIKKMMERKYNLRVNDVTLTLFPIWKCTLENKKTKESREVVLDGIFANFIEYKN